MECDVPVEEVALALELTWLDEDSFDEEPSVPLLAREEEFSLEEDDSLVEEELDSRAEELLSLELTELFAFLEELDEELPALPDLGAM